MHRSSAIEHERPRILLLQQTDQTAAITAHRLRLLGYDVSECARADRIDEALEAHQPNLLLIDSRPSPLGGIELVERLHGSQYTSEIPILACSSDSSPDAIRAAFTAGASDYLLMPFDPVTLEHKVDSLLPDFHSVTDEV